MVCMPDSDLICLYLRVLAMVIVSCSWARHTTFTIINACLHPGSKMSGKPDKVLAGGRGGGGGGTCDGLAFHPEGVRTLLVAPCS